MSGARRKLEYGDYQTPAGLAEASCCLLARLGVKPRAILEPSCGLGSLLKAGVEGFQSVVAAKGFDINPEYVSAARSRLGSRSADSVAIEPANFFDTDWAAVADSLPQPLLVLGNPPWVTNSVLGTVGSGNLPRKSNFQGHSGLDALTGKSNFDISEYMLIRLSEALQGKEATLAMLCKAAVARKVMAYCWKRGLEMGGCQIFPIDAARDFGAAVEACLFVASFNGKSRDRVCTTHEAFDPTSRSGQIGYCDGLLIADWKQYQEWSFLRGETSYKWRSGVKHDCGKVMEFTGHNGNLVNGFGESVDLEDAFLFPLLKSSAIAGSEKAGLRQVLVTQRNAGDDTSLIANTAPKTWKYLLDHAEWLDSRASSIYRKRPRFSVFGVGDYSFAPWKVAISGFYKKLGFKVIPSVAGRPAMLDDTAYFLGCEGEYEAVLLAAMLNAAPAKEFLSSLIFWDAKRPITVGVLSQLSIERLVEHLGKADLLKSLLKKQHHQPLQQGLLMGALS